MAHNHPSKFLRIDHHVHIQTKRASNALIEQKRDEKEDLLESDGEETGGPRILQLLEDASLQGAFVLSSAYLFAPGADCKDPDNEQNSVKEENDWALKQASDSNGKLFALCSLNPLRDYAISEIARCSQFETDGARFRGLKLHFANSGINLRSPEHVRKIQSTLAAASKNKWCVLIHLPMRYEFRPRELVRTFSETIWPYAQGTPIILAHLGHGMGDMFGTVADSVAKAFEESCEKYDRSYGKLFFDLSFTIPPQRRPENVVRHWSEYWGPRLARRLRGLGVERILFGSDWPNSSPQEYLNSIQKNLPLSPMELDTIMTNTVP